MLFRSAQYYGARDFKSIKKILGMDIVIGLSLALFTFLIVQLFAPQIIGLFADDEQVIGYGVQYIRIVAVTYLFVGVSFAISFNSRSVQILKVPTIVNACSILTNTILNYALIYGNFGLPALGVRGAAIATLIARFIELTALVTYLAVDKKHPFHGHLKEFTGFTGALLKRLCERRCR